MILDSSALVAIAGREPDAHLFQEAILAAPSVSISAGTLLETRIVMGWRKADPDGQLLEALLAAGLRVVPFDARQCDLAAEAYARFGRGSGSKAGLNYGDCFSYALAVDSGEPLLFKGDDFRHTDVRSALP